MSSFFISALRSGWRGHSFRVVFMLGLLLIGGAYLAAQFSPRQPQTVALDVGLSGMRFSLVLLALFWTQELVGKEIERHTAILYLAHPIPRSYYILGRFSGIALLLLAATATLALLLWITTMASGGNYAQSRPPALGLPFWAAVLGIWLDAAVVTAFALCMATLSTVPALPLALGAAFAIAGRSMGAVLDYLARGADGQQEMVATYGAAMDLIRWVLPDLSRLDWRALPMYDLRPLISTLGWSTLMALSYAGLMLAIATWSFNRREFD